LGAVNIGNPDTGTITSAICCYRTTAEPLVTIGGVSAVVQFSGLAPDSLGVYHINVLIPDNAPAGAAVPVSLRIGGVLSNTVTVAVQ
jgi:uncharacterized protein (TIGR03437 family)